MAKSLGDINEVLQATPELNKYPVHVWQQTYDFLQLVGFRKQKFTYMISQDPRLLTTSQDKLISSLNDWRAFQFGERNTFALLERHPELLQLQTSSDLVRKISTIEEFVGSGSNIFKVLLNSPTVLAQSLPNLNEKIEYFKTVMKVDKNEVYNSEAFSIDIIALKTRHIFLERLGLYIVKKRKNPNEISKNPKLFQVTDTSDKTFATKICHVTLEEFETFQELYQRELEDGTEEESDNENYEDDGDIKVAADWEK